MTRSEQVARYLVEAALPGSTMCFRVRQSHGEHDFDLILSEGTSAALEVTSSVEAEYRSQIAAISDERKGTHFINATQCENGWYIHLAPGAKVTLVRQKADAYLAGLEKAGIYDFHAGFDDHPLVDRILNDLGVEAGRTLTWKGGRQIGIGPASRGGWMSSLEFHSAVLEEASKEDNRSKLARAATLERHLFVYIDGSRFLAWGSLVSNDSIQCVVHLPEEVTHVWAAAHSGSKASYRLRRASQGEMWEDLGLFDIPELP